VLVVILVGGAISSGWVAVMSAETAYVETMTDSAKRRVAVGNATALARQYLLTRLLTKSVASAPEFTADLTDGWGRMTIPAIGAAVEPMAATDAPDGWNHFNPAEGAGFSDRRLVAIRQLDGDPPLVREFLLRSYATELAGSLLVRNETPVGSTVTNVVAGSLSVGGEAVLWRAEVGTITAGSFNAPTASLPDVAVANFPFVPRTGGDNVLGVAAFDGRLNVVDRLAAKVPSSQAVQGFGTSSVTGVTSDGSGTLTFDLANPNLERVFVDGRTTRIIFAGQTTLEESEAARNAIAALVVFVQPLGSENLADVDFLGVSERKLVFAVKKIDGSLAATNFNFTGISSGQWRSIFAAENAELTLNVGAGTREIVGGLRSDRDVAVPTGAISISREPQPRLLDRLTARDAWLEVFTP
jgi:hypothetical protein